MFKEFSKEHSYLIGFFQADGHLSFGTQNRMKLAIELKDSDVDILNKIEELLKDGVHVGRGFRTRDTNFKKNYKSCSLTITEGSFLRKYFNPYIPNGKKDMIVKTPEWVDSSNYLRGYFDGNGSIGFTKNKKDCFICFCTKSEYIKKYLTEAIKKETGEIKETARNKRDNIYNISVMNESAIKFSEFLYQNKNLYLNRKFENYNDIKKWVRTFPKRNFEVKKWNKEEDAVVLSENLILSEKMKILNRTEKSINIRIWRLTGKYPNKVLETSCK